MTAQLIDGKEIGKILRARVAEQARALPVPPGLAVVLAGDDAASKVYVASKEKAALAAGFASHIFRLPANVSQAELLAQITALNDDSAVHAILVQLPLPAGIDAAVILDAVDPAKDVDGFHPLNAGLLQEGRAKLVPCTPQGCLRLLRETGATLPGARALVVGRSRIVGKPMAALLLRADCTVTIAHIATRELEPLCREAEIIVTAVGKPGLIPGAWIKEGAVLIDVGITRLPDGRLTGDLEFEAAAARASFITPVPGGVGPMTIACLLRNAAVAAALQQGRADIAQSLLAL